MNTSNYHDVGVWLGTAERQDETAARESNVSRARDLTASDRWNLAVLVATALASTIFFLIPLLTAWVSYSPPPAPVPTRFARAASPLVLDVRNESATTPARSKRREVKGPVSRPPSRLARLFLGDGSVAVRPFPRPDK